MLLNTTLVVHCLDNYGVCSRGTHWIRFSLSQSEQMMLGLIGFYVGVHSETHMGYITHLRAWNCWIFKRWMSNYSISYSSSLDEVEFVETHRGFPFIWVNIKDEMTTIWERFATLDKYDKLALERKLRELGNPSTKFLVPPLGTTKAKGYRSLKVDSSTKCDHSYSFDEVERIRWTIQEGILVFIGDEIYIMVIKY